MSENSCQLCAVEKLTFEPPPIYCTPCGARIKRNVMYYTMGSGDTRHYFCVPCYNEARGDTIEVDGSAFPKARLEKKRNDEETEEWVGFNSYQAGEALGIIMLQGIFYLLFMFCCSGFNVINVKPGSIKYALFLMAEEMMEDKLSTPALIAI